MVFVSAVLIYKLFVELILVGVKLASMHINIVHRTLAYVRDDVP